MTLAGYNLQDNVYIYSNNKCMCVFLISPVPITEPLTSKLIDTPVFYNLAPRPIKYRVSVPIPTYIMVPGQLSLSEREQNQRADRGLQEETAAALHPSYDQWDPCGESEQLQVPRCKHLRGPDMDCTHPNTGEESQAKAVPSATAEEIQGLTSYPENFLLRGHRKCTDSVHLSVV